LQKPPSRRKDIGKHHTIHRKQAVPKGQQDQNGGGLRRQGKILRSVVLRERRTGTSTNSPKINNEAEGKNQAINRPKQRMEQLETQTETT
jgi:hypothetical protein